MFTVDVEFSSANDREGNPQWWGYRDNSDTVHYILSDDIEIWVARPLVNDRQATVF